MLNLLRARECGYAVEGLDDVLHERWTLLRSISERSIRVSFSGVAVPVLTFDTATGELLLAAGENELNSGRSGAVAIFKRPEKGNTPANLDHMGGTRPVAMSRSRDCSNGFATSAAWFPGDAGLFVLGMDEGRRVGIWDTERLTCIATSMIGSAASTGHDETRGTGSVLTVQFPSHPLARSSLVAAACSNLRHVTLLDLDSGTASHVLRGPRARAPVHDARWSPLHPHHIATIDITGEISLFDIRRSGAIACLSQMSPTSRKFPQPDDFENRDPPVKLSQPVQRPEPTLKTTFRKKRRRRKDSEQDTGRDTIGSELQSVQSLGLRCNWRPLWDGRHDSLHTHRYHGVSSMADPGWSLQERSRTSKAVVRYTWDGSTLVSCCGRYEGFYTHDVLTGCLLSSLGGLGTFISQPEPQHLPQRLSIPLLFEVARDNEHVVSTAGKNLCVFDIKTGALVHHATDGGVGYFEALALHPFEEEVYTSAPRYITCWSSTGRDDDENENGDGEEGNGQ